VLARRREQLVVTGQLKRDPVGYLEPGLLARRP